MRLLQANKILLGTLVIALPLSFAGGLKLKERYLQGEFDRADDKEAGVMGSAARARARVSQLQHERGELEKESHVLQDKIAELRKRMEGRHVV